MRVDLNITWPAMARWLCPNAGTGFESCRRAFLLETMTSQSMLRKMRSGCSGQQRQSLKGQSVTSLERWLAQQLATEQVPTVAGSFWTFSEFRAYSTRSGPKIV